MEEKRLIEAALFISARPMGLEEMKKLTGIGAIGFLKKMVEELKKEYEKRGSAITIDEIEGKYIMTIKREYSDKVREFAQEEELSKSALRTLAYLSKHDGILKSELVKKLGTGAYYDVRELVENGFIKQKKAGRTSKLILTEKFRRYFKEGK